MKTLNLLLAAALVLPAAACTNGAKNAQNNETLVVNETSRTKADAAGANAPRSCDSISTGISASALTGSWDQPIEGMKGRQGMKLDSNGTASSIDMATLVFEKWSVRADSLSLSGKSIGNGQTIDFTESYKIEKCSPDSLVLSQNGAVVFRYARVK